MGIPIKKSRAIEVDGQRYRYLVRRGEPRKASVVGFAMRIPIKSGTRVLTAQRQGQDGKPSGQILQVHLSCNVWAEQDERSELISVPPELVKTVIRESLARGWDPDKDGLCRRDHAVRESHLTTPLEGFIVREA